MLFRKITSSILSMVMLLSSPAAAVDLLTVKRSARETARGQQSAEQTEEDVPAEYREVAPRTRGLDVPVDPDTYLIGPSDEFVLSLRGQTQEDIRLMVLPEGIVMLPNIGAFRAAGLTITEFKKNLFGSLERYYRNMEFDCQLLTPRSFIVYVLGEVNVPGAVEIHAPFRVGTAINSAGGTTKNGSLRYIEIREAGKPVRTVDLFSFFGLGEIDSNVVLREGQSIYVPVKHRSVVVFGEVWNGGAFEIYDNETAADLFRFGGGLTNYADTTRVVLERYDNEGRVSVRRLKPGEWDEVVLQNRDVVVVPDRRYYVDGGYVEVLGGAGREGRVHIEDGETLGSFLPRILRTSERFDLRRGVIERRGEDGAKLYYFKNLEAIIEGSDDGSFRLHDGDAIAIPTTDSEVYVAGEVVEPGAVAYLRGLPAERYIAHAGGPNNSGSVDKLTIYASDGTKRKGDRKSMVYRGDTILVERKTSKIFGAVFMSLSSFTSLILSIIAVSRN